MPAKKKKLEDAVEMPKADTAAETGEEVVGADEVGQPPEEGGSMQVNPSDENVPLEQGTAPAERRSVRNNDLLTISDQERGTTAEMNEAAKWNYLAGAVHRKSVLSGIMSGTEMLENGNMVATIDYEGIQFVIPGISRDFQRRHSARTELLLSYNKQNRPEFHRRVFTGTWRYRWQATSGRTGYQYDFLDLNYVSMPWISETFKRDYLDSSTNRNAILRYNYEDLLIMKMGFGFTYNDGRHFLKLNVETAGNALAGAARLFRFSKNDEGQYKFALVAFAQYVKVDADYTRLLKLDHRNALALHARVGVAVPYGNSSILPFEKRYFSGGANSVRGWSVRELGPGRYRGTDGRIDFINQTGDMRIDLNAELRTNLFWKFQGAIFIDAGNVWTLRDYADQPGGVFTLRSIYDEMAVAYGLGVRLNFNYFILRLDLGMKAVNPNYTDSRSHFPITHPDFGRDCTLHFAVGLPF